MTGADSVLRAGMMRDGGCRHRARAIARLCTLIVSLGASAQTLPPSAPGLRADALIDPNRPYAQEQQSSAAPDLVLGIAGSVAIASSATSIALWDPKVVEISNGKSFPATTTVAIAELQTTLFDPAAFPGYPFPWGTAPTYAAQAGVAHEQSTDEDPPASWEAPAAFLKTLAHQLIDNGADAFVTTGIHHVAGIEIYRGKPIFYGLGNFNWSDIQLPLSADLYESNTNREYLERSFNHPERATDADLSLVMNANSTFATAGSKSLNRTFQSVLTRTVYDDATQLVKEIRLYPIELGYGEKLTSSGIPRRAGQTVANMVLDRIISLSGRSGVMIRKVNDGPYLIGVATPK